MGDSVFWGLIVEPGKPSAYVPPPEDARLHISQAVLDPAAEDGARVWLRCKVQDGPSLAVAALRCGGSEAQALDLILDQYSEFSVEGPAPVHVTGYFIPVEEEYEEHDHGEDDEEDEEDDEDALAQQFGLPRGMTLDQMRQMYADGDLDLDNEDDDDDDDDDEEDDEEDDEDDAAPLMFGGAAAAMMDDIDNDDDDDDEEDDEDDEETSDYDSEDEAGARFKSEVVIEELDPQPPEEVAKAAGQKRKADLAAMEPKSAKRPAAQAKPVVKLEAAAAKPKNGQQTPAGNGAAGAAAMEQDEDDDEEDDEDDDDDEEEDEDEAMPQEQQQRTRQQSKQKLPSIAKALDDAAATALASGKKQQQQQQQQPSAQKKGKNKQQPEANGLDTPEATAAGTTAKTPASGGRKSVRRFENGFIIEDVAIGQPDGKLAKGGKRVQMKYVGRLASNGKVFDQTKGSKPFTFRLGVGEVIKGWDRGVDGMRVGDRRKLTIPPSMAYGTKGAPPDIPPNAKLVFDVELVNVL